MSINRSISDLYKLISFLFIDSNITTYSLINSPPAICDFCNLVINGPMVLLLNDGLILVPLTGNVDLILVSLIKNGQILVAFTGNDGLILTASTINDGLIFNSINSK